jgi:hypothetical protein
MLTGISMWIAGNGLERPNLYAWLSDTYTAQPIGRLLTIAASFATLWRCIKPGYAYTGCDELALISYPGAIHPTKDARAHFYLLTCWPSCSPSISTFSRAYHHELISFYAYAIYLFESNPAATLAILLLGLLVFLSWDALKCTTYPQPPSLQEGEQRSPPSPEKGVGLVSYITYWSD